MIGKRFGYLSVVCRAPSYKSGQARWNCICDCGKTTTVEGGNLRQGRQISCGCYNDQLRGIPRLKHGHTSDRYIKRQSSEYTTWLNIRSRCYNPSNNRYLYYGARGIRVCDRWLESFENFLSDMGVKPHPRLTIERIETNGNYEPGNCKWATYKEQRANRRPMGITDERPQIDR